ncbi:IS110 family transposase [uncultured Adlercreutzia sp.]|uniref:IS110 family transposase n=1 Tax=uncultured Adlercreutzia sp. TaxID=875803 RepID=UPI0026F3EA07|nr:IS110 family transposase [uncultured Adlercreutzia sp.]
MLYAGIDIAKRLHWMAVTDADGTTVMEARPYENTRDGLARMVGDLDLLGGDVAVGMESTGHYWRACFRALSGGGYAVSVINPVRTHAARRAANLGRAKTDRVDCKVIADVVRKEAPAATRVADGKLAELHDLSRFQQVLAESAADAKIRVGTLLDQIWPEFSRLFSDTFGGSAMAALRLLASGSMEGLDDALAAASRNRFGSAKGDQVRESLATTCGIPATAAHLLQLRILLDQLDSLRAQSGEVESAMAALIAETCPQVLTVPGLGPKTAAQIVAEIGDPARFPDARAVCSYAGLDPRPCESGDFASEHRRITKTGSCHLRRALYLAAQANMRSDNVFRDYYERLRGRGKPHRLAAVATARKMLCVVWALMVSGEEFDPERGR